MLRRGGTGSAQASVSGGSADSYHHHDHEEQRYGNWQVEENHNHHPHQEENVDVDSYFANLFTGDKDHRHGNGSHQNGSIPPALNQRGGGGGGSGFSTSSGYDSRSHHHSQGIVDTTELHPPPPPPQQLQQQQGQHHEHHKYHLSPMHHDSAASGYSNEHPSSGYSEDNFIGGGFSGGVESRKQAGSPYGSPTAVNQHRILHSLPMEGTESYGYASNPTTSSSGRYGNEHLGMNGGSTPFPPHPPSLQQNSNQGSWNGQYGGQQQQQQQQHYGSPYPPPPPAWTTFVTEPLLKARTMAMSVLNGVGGPQSSLLRSNTYAGYHKKQDDGGSMMPPGTSTISETLASDSWMSGLLTPPNQTPPHSSNNNNMLPHHPSPSSQGFHNFGNMMMRRSNNSPQEQRRNERLAMIGLVLLLFVGMNLGSLVKVEQSAFANMRERRNRRKNNGPLLHEEGMDRPNSLAYLKQVRGRGWGGAKATSSSSTASTAAQGQMMIPQKKQPWGDSRSSTSAQQRQQQIPPNPKRTISQPPPQKQQQMPPPPPENNFALDHLMSKATPEKPPQTPPQPPTASGPSSNLPTAFNNVATVGKEFPPYNAATDIPMFWHIPKAGGSSLKEIFGMCMGLTLGCELGADPQHASAQLETFDVAQRTVLNVDFYNPQGIEKARSLNVALSGKVDLVVSPYLQESATLFTPSNQGRMFTLLRHPIDRALSSYGLYLQLEQKAHPGAPPLSLVDYAKSNRIENNWMTRFLSGKMSGPLTDVDFNLAKQILKTKFIVGLFDQREEFLQRLNLYFGWSAPNSPSQQKSKLNPTDRHKCIQQHMAQASPANRFTQHSPVQKIQEGSKEYVLLTRQNNFDMQLYEFAANLFKEQRSLFI